MRKARSGDVSRQFGNGPVTGNTILDLIAPRAAQSHGAAAVFHRVGKDWRPISLGTILQTSERVARSLSEIGLKPNDRLAIMCRTRVEWLLAELAAMIAGVIVVGIDAHASGAQMAQILEDSKTTALIVDADGDLSRIPLDIRERLSLVVAIERHGENRVGPVPHLVYWAELVDDLVTRDISQALQLGPDCNGLSATALLYTSGTTGRPKGILYHQAELAVACRAILDEFPSVSESGGTTICWLPMAALFQRMMNYVALASGVAIYFVEDPTTIGKVAKEVQPTYFVGVPRFFEKLYQGIHEELASKPRWARRLVEYSLANSPRVAGMRRRVGRTVRWRVLDALVLKRLRGVLGQRLQFMITGSAPTPVWMLDYFDRLGILLLEAYGLSENTVPIAANRPEAYRFGSVGKVFKANDIRVAEDGEILVRGPGLFSGFLEPGGSEGEVFTEDGYYRTGDLGRIDAEGFLFITGRKSDAFKLSTGRWIAPVHIEAAYKKIPYIEQFVVVGRGRPFPAALLTINEKLLASVLRGRKLSKPARGRHDFGLTSQAFRSQIEVDLEAAGSDLNAYERIRHYESLPVPLSLEGGELTASLKLRREAIEQKYGALIDHLYAKAS